FLRAAQLGRRDGLHRLGDLPRVDHAADTAPDVENVGHFQFSVPSSRFSVKVSSCPALTENWEPRTENFYFATACLDSTNCCFASFTTRDISDFRLSSRIFLSMIVFNRPGFVVSTYLYSSFSKSRT